MSETVTFYEIYSKRALHEPIAELVVLDRDRSLKKARASARAWGACVVRVEAEVLRKFPLVRRVVRSEVIWVHKPRKQANQDRNVITRRQLMGKIRSNNKSLYRGYRR